MTAPALRAGGRAAGVVLALVVATAGAPGVLPIGVVVQGAVFGATTGLLAVGLVLTYQATRIVNFAHGAMGALGASVGVSLYLGADWPWLTAVVVGVAVAAAVGVAVDALVIRRFESASRLTLTVATIGVAQVLGGISLLVPGWLDAPLLIGAFDTGLSSTTLRLRPVLFTGNEMVMVVLVPIAVLGLGWFLRHTDAGVAVRAAAEHRDRARLLAVPVRRLSAGVWATAGGLSALTLLLVAPGQGLQSNLGVTPIALLPALAAAVVAGMSSLWLAFGTAVALGIMDQLIRWHVDAKSVTTVVFLAVIVLALLLRRDSLGRDEPGEAVLGAAAPAPAAARSEGERPRRGRNIRWGALAAGAAVLVGAPAVLSASDVYLFSTGVVYAMVAVSLVVLTGWGGQVSLGQYAFVGVGGVVAANLVLRFNLDLFWALSASGVAGALMAVVIGLPALRIRGAFLAVSTLAFAVAVDSYAFNPTNFASWLPFSVDRPVLLHRFDLASEVSFAYFALALLMVTIALVSGLRRGRAGRSVLAVRDNPRAAAAMAVPVTRTRLAAFVLAGAVAGVAGGLHVHLLGGIGTNTYAPATSLVLFSMVVIGGVESVPGAVVGVAVVQVLGRFFPDHQVILTGVGMLLLLLVVPGGLAEVGRRTRDRLVRLRPASPGLEDAMLPVGVSSGDLGVEAVPGGAAALLRCEGVEAAYGPLQVLFGVDLGVEEGEVVALLGTNGAGKSSVLRAVTGLLPTSGGSITFEGQRLDGRSVEAIARSGIAMVPGGRGVFPGLTVAENLRVATWAFRREPATVSARQAEVLEQFPVLRERLDQAAGSLSGGEQQMLALAQAFLGRPRLLLIDELSIGLAPAVVSDLLEAVRGRVADGVTVVLVEQSVNVALAVAERAVFLEKGEVRFSGPTVDLLDRPDVLRAVFLAGPAGGTRTRPRAKRATGVADEVVLSCRGLSKRFGGIIAVDDVDLDVRAGEVLGLVGHNGAGKTTLFDLLSGFLAPDGGSMQLGDVDLTSLTPSERAVLGLARSFQEARLFPSLDVRETLSLALDRHLHGRGDGFVTGALRLPPATDAERLVAERVTELVDQLGLGAYARTPIAHLSTGTRRIVELGCVLAAAPKVLLLDEPSAGVAQRETEHLGPLLRQVQAETGCSIVIIEHDMPLLTGLCDGFVALDRGRVITRGRPRAVLDHPQVIASYLGRDAAAIARSGGPMIRAERLTSFVRRTAKLSDAAPIAPVAVLFGLNFVDELDRIAFATLTPEIRDAFGLSDTGIASVTVVTGLFLLFAAVPIGLAADRRNRVRLATAAAAMWGTMSVLTGVVPTLALLILVRFFSGLGRGMNEVVHPSLLSDLYEPGDQPAVFSLHKLANPVSAVSALLAGLIGATIGWRWAFVLLALPTIPLLLAVRRMPEPPRGRYATVPTDPLDVELAVASTEAPPSLREAWRTMWAVRSLRRVWAAAFVVGMAAVPAAVFMTLFFEDEYGFGALGRGFAQVVLGVGGAAGLLLAGRLAPRSTPERDETPTLAVHIARWLALGGVGILCTALAPIAALSVASLAIVGLGTGGLQPVLLALVGRVTPVSCRSVAFGVTALSLGFGAIASLALFGLGESTGYRVALVAAGVLTLVAALVIGSARRTVAGDLARAAVPAAVAE